MFWKKVNKDLPNSETIDLFKVFLKIIIIIWIVEGVIMLAFSYLPKMPDLLEAFVDATSLSILSSVPIWLWIIRPLKLAASKYFSRLESLKQALDSAAIVAVTDSKGKISYANNKFSEVSGYESEELVGKDHRIINSKYHAKEYFRELWATISKGIVWRGIIKNQRKDKTFYWVDTTIVPMKDELNKITEYIAIRYDISHQKKLEEELIKAKNLAEEALLSKSQFLANMSHEIRTPMNGIVGMTNILLNSIQDEDSKDRLRIIQSSCDTLVEIINDILDFSKLEAGKIQIENQAFLLHQTVNDVIKLLSNTALEKNINLTYNWDINVPGWIMGDAIRLKQILTNLINNSIKFTEKGFVRVHSSAKVTQDNNWIVQFSVADSGIGIPENGMEKLFHSFTQADSTTTRKFGGTGLGLAISKNLCEKMGGRMWAESTIGKGSTFYFTLETVVAKEKTLIQEEMKFDSAMSSKYPLRILVAEDNLINQKVILGMLESLGYYADVVPNGREVLNILKEKEYDLILMDCHMPEMDGYEATTQIRKEIKFRPTIIALTASTMKEDIERCVKSGMNGFIGKPIDPSSLMRVLEKHAKFKKAV